MIKADAYGLGAIAVARALESTDPWGYGVATLPEAGELRAAGIARRILIFTPLLPEDLGDAIRLGVTPTFGSADLIEAWSGLGGGAWHLAIDTGMHRAGIEWWRVSELAEAVRAFPPEGAFTHFHSADATDASFDEQERRFHEAVGTLPARPRVLHAENSPAIARRSPSRWDLARPGVALYGVGVAAWPDLAPEPVAHLRARVVELHSMRPGETVSYNATWTAETPRAVATLAVGYADGYRRAFANRGEAIIQGRRVPVVGRVTMDMTMVDVTGVPCQRGDVATLIGRDGDEHLDLNVLAERVDVLAYELLVGLRLRVPRIARGQTA
jgi:alanine racemase